MLGVINLLSTEFKYFDGFSYSVTGENGIVFFFRNQKICHIANPVIPKCSTFISSEQFSFESDFDYDCTLVPGLKRYVMDIGSQKQVAYLQYIDKSLYKLKSNAEFMVCTKSEETLFLLNHYEIALLKRVSDRTDAREIYGEYFPLRYVAKVYQTLSNVY